MYARVRLWVGAMTAPTRAMRWTRRWYTSFVQSPQAACMHGTCTVATKWTTCTHRRVLRAVLQHVQAPHTQPRVHHTAHTAGSGPGGVTVWRQGKGTGEQGAGGRRWNGAGVSGGAPHLCCLAGPTP